jgi:hypothetical protein
MDTRLREQLGAAAGLLTAVLFGVSFVIGLKPNPPNLDAGAAPIAAFVSNNQDALRVQVLLNTVAMLSFLWFLGSVRAGLRTAEGGAGRVSAIASGGGLVGAAFVLLAQVFAAAAALNPLDIGPRITLALIDLEALSVGIGASAFAVFFLAVAGATLLDGGLPKWLGWLSIIAALSAALGVVTGFSNHGIFAADGAFGFWVRYAVFVVWVAITSVVLINTAPKGRRRRST